MGRLYLTVMALMSKCDVLFMMTDTLVPLSILAPAVSIVLFVALTATALL